MVRWTGWCRSSKPWEMSASMSVRIICRIRTPPFAILTHCVGLTRYFIGNALAGRQVHRDRDAEFRAQGTVAEIRQAVRELQQRLSDDLARVHGDQPCAFPE